MFRWNEKAARYVGAGGRFVSRLVVRAALDRALDARSAVVRALSGQLRDRRITLAEWETRMMAEVKAAHLYSAAAAKGGWAQMTQADYGRVGAAVRDQYGYLRRFGRQIASGEQPLDGVFLARAEMYGQAGRKTHHEFERREMELRGMNEERNVLGVADHCDQCVGETQRGWVPIGTLKPVGARTCVTRCKCTIQYRAA